MFTDPAADLMTEALRIFFLGTIPLLATVGLVGSLVGMLQATMSFQDAALQYAARLVVATAVLYMTGPPIARAISDLMLRALAP